MKFTYSQKRDVTRSLIKDGDKEHFVTDQDVTALIDANKIRAELVNKKDAFRHIAEIPIGVIEEAMRQGWLEDADKFAHWMNDPDNKVFRVWGGTVSGKDLRGRGGV